MFAALVNHACCGVDAGGEPDGSKLGTRKISLDGGWSLSFAKQPREEARTPEAFAGLSETVDSLEKKIWKDFVCEYGFVLDYKGDFPSPQDCLDGRSEKFYNFKSK